MKRLPHPGGLRFLALMWILAAENRYIDWCVPESTAPALARTPRVHCQPIVSGACMRAVWYASLLSLLSVQY